LPKLESLARILLALQATHGISPFQSRARRQGRPLLPALVWLLVAGGEDADDAHDFAARVALETHQAVVEVADQELVVADRQQAPLRRSGALVVEDAVLQGHVARPGVGAHERGEIFGRQSDRMAAAVEDLP